MRYLALIYGNDEIWKGDPDRPRVIAAVNAWNQQLTESGELVFQQGLADPSQARTVRVQQGVPVATDGPFAESRESLAGFWVVDVENEARAVEIAARISQAADGPIEVRQCMDAPPDDVMEQIST